MHRTETVDSFKRFSGKSKVLFGLSKDFDAVSAGDLGVMCVKYDNDTNIIKQKSNGVANEIA